MMCNRPSQRVSSLLDCAQGKTQLNWKNKQITTEEMHLLALRAGAFLQEASRKWENLWLAGNRLTDSGLGAMFSLLLRYCDQVKVLDLRANSLTDFGVDQIAAFVLQHRSSMRVLYLDNNLMSDAGYLRLMQSLADTKVQVFTTSVQVIPREMYELVMRSHLKRVTVDPKCLPSEQQQLKRALKLSGKWVGAVMAFASLKSVRRLTHGVSPCHAALLPNELVRMLSTFL